MDKETFLKLREEVAGKINQLRDVLDDLEKEYVLSNQPYPIGSKVRISYPGNSTSFSKDNTPVVYWIVKDYYLNYDEVIPTIAKIKKNGTPCQKSEWLIRWWKKPIIEICNE